MLKEAIDEKALNLLKLCEQVIEFLVVVFLDALDLLSHRTQLCDLVFNLVLELSDFALEILH